MPDLIIYIDRNVQGSFDVKVQNGSFLESELGFRNIFCSMAGHISDHQHALHLQCMHLGSQSLNKARFDLDLKNPKPEVHNRGNNAPSAHKII